MRLPNCSCVLREPKLRPGHLGDCSRCTRVVRGGFGLGCRSWSLARRGDLIAPQSPPKGGCREEGAGLLSRVISDRRRGSGLELCWGRGGRTQEEFLLCGRVPGRAARGVLGSPSFWGTSETCGGPPAAASSLPPSLLALPLGSTKTPRLLSQNTQILQNTAEGWGQGCTEGRMGLEPDLCRWQGRGGGCRDVILPVLCCRNRLGLGQGDGFG